MHIFQISPIISIYESLCYMLIPFLLLHTFRVCHIYIDSIFTENVGDVGYNVDMSVEVGAN